MRVVLYPGNNRVNKIKRTSVEVPCVAFLTEVLYFMIENCVLSFAIDYACEAPRKITSL